MNRERLLKLADFLETLPPSRFNFSSWFGNGADGRPDISCNSTACALGWATAIPEFRALGLHGRLVDQGFAAICMGDPEDAVANDFWGVTCDATGKLFDLSEAETELLFVPHDGDDDDVDGKDSETGQLARTATPRRVAQHIREFVG